MKVHTNQHSYYCGIDLHARKMYVCIINDKGDVKIQKNIPTDADELIALISPFLADILVGVEGVFCWYWPADHCTKHNIHCTLGHAW